MLFRERRKEVQVRSFYWMQYFFSVKLNLLSVLSEREPQEYLGLSYFLGKRQRHLMILKNDSEFLVVNLDQYVCSISENSKEWEDLNLSYCRKMRNRGLSYGKIFCTCRSRSLYK